MYRSTCFVKYEAISLKKEKIARKQWVFNMSQACVPVLTQICAPVPHSTLIHTITKCAKSTWCSSSLEASGQKAAILNRAEMHFNEKEINNNKQSENDDFQDSLFAVLDSVDRFIDEDALLELAYALGLDNEKIELPDLKSVSETTILSCLR